MYINPRIKAILMAGTLALTAPTLTGCGETKKETNRIAQEKYQEFDVGEHIVAVVKEYKVINNAIEQYDYHHGYEIIDVTMGTDRFCIDGAVTIVYQNIEPVIVHSTDKYGEEFAAFGTPIERTKTYTK